MAQKTREETQNKNNKTTRETDSSRHRLAFHLVFDLWFFPLRLLGTLIANGFRIIGGNTYQVLCLALAVYGDGWQSRPQKLVLRVYVEWLAVC